VTPTKKEMYVMGFVWVVALCAIVFSYVSAANKREKSKVSECPVYVPTSGTVVLTECADKKGK
tara:strand:- start:428 stop:616 length:189 start_codon:yes stop_codon:yes gene_type:complete